MEKTKYTGELAQYATMMALTEAMKATNYLTPHPNRLITDFLDMLQRLTIEVAPLDVRRRCSSATFAAMMQAYVAECGLSHVEVLKRLKAYERSL